MDSSSPMITCVLKVNTHSRDWHNTLIGVLKGLQDVSYSIDARQGLAYVSGKVEPHKILRMLGKAEKHVTLSHVHCGNQTPARYNPSPHRNMYYECYHCGKIDDYTNNYENGYFPYGKNDGCRFGSDYPYGSPSPSSVIPHLNHGGSQLYYGAALEQHAASPIFYRSEYDHKAREVKEYSCCHIM